MALTQRPMRVVSRLGTFKIAAIDEHYASSNFLVGQHSGLDLRGPAVFNESIQKRAACWEANRVAFGNRQPELVRWSTLGSSFLGYG